MRVQVQQFAKETHSSVQHATGRAGCAGSITEHLGTRWKFSVRGCKQFSLVRGQKAPLYKVGLWMRVCII